MKKILIIIPVVLIVFAGSVLAFWYFNNGRWPVWFKLQKITERVAQNVEQVAEKVSAPPPLRATEESPSAYLTRAGIVAETNLQRKNNGLPALTANAELNAAAAAKVKDMFANQYFEHLSPSGAGPGQFAKDAGYVYIMVGENLAMGNYEDDKAVIQAWMASPGHRENILSEDFLEIGVAVAQGTLNGEKTWLAVQEFGKPRSACPSTDETLRAQIAADEERLKTLKNLTDQIKTSFDAAPKLKTQEEVDAYNAEVDRYNEMVVEINQLIEKIQGEVTVYNGQVQATNACIGN